MALDESQESDVVFTDRGIQYLIDKNLFDEVKPVKVDFMKSFRGSGFQLTSSLSKRPAFGDGCSSC
jgi:Fe-S cluster assembly iron-binding protein IscA